MLHENRMKLSARKSTKRWATASALAISVCICMGRTCRGDEPAPPNAAQATQGTQVTQATEMGPAPVEVAPEMVLRDKKRDKDLPLFITHPQGDGPFPVIIFSHGAGATGKHYEALLKFWSTNGYISI